MTARASAELVRRWRRRAWASSMLAVGLFSSALTSFWAGDLGMLQGPASAAAVGVFLIGAVYADQRRRQVEANNPVIARAALPLPAAAAKSSRKARRSSAREGSALLPPGSVGAHEADRLTNLRTQIVRLLPAIDALHEGAGAELMRADAEAAPGLQTLISRLSLLQGVSIDMPGSPSAHMAMATAEEIRVRLAEGVDCYERLLSAALQMLGAPDAAMAVDHRLEQSVAELAAYAHGLRVAATA